MEKIRVIVWGTGNMGSGMIKMLLDKPAVFEVVAGIKKRPVEKGTDLGEALGLGKKIGAIATNDPKEVIKEGAADIVLHTTNSFTKDVYEELKLILEAGLNCITIAEEMAYPWANEADLADQLDELAEENGVTLLGTGVNPGFVLDTLVVTLTGACLRVDKIEASRINDLSPFGKTVMETQGVGTTPEEFQKGIEDGSIVGHIGFPESISMIFEAMGWELGDIKQTREPIISNTHRETPCVKVEPGMVAGCRHIGIGYDTEGNEKVKLVHPQQIHPGMENIETGDYIKIFGDPEINMAITPEIPGGKGTIAAAVNMIPHVVDCYPGLVTMLDLPIPHAIMNEE